MEDEKLLVSYTDKFKLCDTLLNNFSKTCFVIKMLLNQDFSCALPRNLQSYQLEGEFEIYRKSLGGC